MVHQRERKTRPAGTLGRQLQQHDRILAAREQQNGIGRLPGDLAQDVDRLGLQPVQVRQRSRSG